jgi:hypothetical protein
MDNLKTHWSLDVCRLVARLVPGALCAQKAQNGHPAPSVSV